MFQIMEESSGNVIGVKVMGKLTHEDYEQFIPYLEESIAQDGPLRLLCEMEEFTGMEPQAVWDDMKFGLGHLRDFERMAVIGDKTWLKWSVALGDRLVKTEVRYFEPAQRAQAWAWLNVRTSGSEEIMADKSFEAELLDLKTQAAENEKTIQDLSDVVCRQGEEIDKLKAEMGVLGREILLMTEGQAETHRGA